MSMGTYHLILGTKLNSAAKQTSDNDICLLFGWFDNQLKSAVQNSLETFWENKFEIKAQSLTVNSTVRNDYASRGEIYFTAELPVCAQANAYVRLSSDFIRVIFHESFGSTAPVFKLQELSELEIKILNSFCEFLNNELKDFIIPHAEIPKSELKNKGVYNITFLIGKNNVKIGKIVITLPQNCLKTEKTELVENFEFSDFLTTSTFVNISVGTSKLALNDLKSLYQGDIILLENSNINYMTIKTGKVRQEFKVNPDPTLMFELDEEEQELGADMAENKNIWDDIQIEVSAEFDKVKMTLGELKQISKGLVIDLGAVFENKISLLVENKVVAKGELVIINDKYGVKIDEIISNPKTKEEAAVPKKTAPKTEAPKKAAGAPNAEQVAKMAAKSAKAAAGEDDENEEFDYSDFEDEDDKA